ncbi:MAG TPA: GGDEF domain-containing protein [Candidatus Bipolaricaulota bacterium]
MLQAQKFEEKLLRFTQDLLSRNDPDEILAKVASTLAEEGHFPEVTLALYDRPHTPETLHGATLARKVTLNFNHSTDGDNRKNVRRPTITLTLKVEDKQLGQAELVLASKAHPPSELECHYYQTLMDIAGISLEQAHRRLKLEDLTFKDDLTGCYNRRYFVESFQRETAWARRYGRVFSLLMLDLDGFKAINDLNGHLTGDAVLSAFGKILCESTRASDLVCRYGGDEFAVLLPETSKVQAQIVAQRLIRKLERQPIRVGRERFKLHISYGISAFAEDENLIEAADLACYRHKTRTKR